MPEIIARSPSGQIIQSAQTPPQGNQTPTNETPPTQPGAKPAPETEQKSPREQQLEALARQEQAKRRQLQARLQRQGQQEQRDKQFQSLQAENQRFRQMYQRFLRDPVSLLNEAGVPGDVISQSLLNSGSREMVQLRQLSIQNQQLQQELKDLKAQFEQGKQQSQETSRSQTRSEIKRLVEDNGSPYEAVKASGAEAQEAIELLIQETLEKEGRYMTVKEAADEVEAYLIDEATKLAGIGKVKEKLTPPPATTTPAVPVVNTLSNRSIPAPSSRKANERDRVARAIAAFDAARAARAGAQ